MPKSKPSYIYSAWALEDIWSYTSQKWTIKQADDYYRLIIREVEDLAKFPLKGKDAGYIRKNYRLRVIKSHSIFYRIDSSKNIEILRILHQNMLTEKHLLTD